MQSLAPSAPAHNIPVYLLPNADFGYRLKTDEPQMAFVRDDGPSGRRAAHAEGGALDLGLVSSQTSDTRSEGPYGKLVQVDPQATRLKRLKCSVLTASRLHAEQKKKWKVAMLTPTYRPEAEWEPNQISALMKNIRSFLSRKGIEFRFVWVLEYTKKGKPHYHVLIWLPLGISLPKPDKQGWWLHGWTKIEWARNAVGYMAKYASKADGLFKPLKGARMHGNGGVTGDALLEQRWWKLPAWARDEVQPSDMCRRRKGGGLLIPATGEVLMSPYIVFFKGGYVYLRDTRCG